jgi:hypothetical protein
VKVGDILAAARKGPDDVTTLLAGESREDLARRAAGLAGRILEMQTAHAAVVREIERRDAASDATS